MSKETATPDSGITTVKGSTTPTASNAIIKQTDLAASLTWSHASLEQVKSLYFPAVGSKTDPMELSYTVTGWQRSKTDGLTFFASRGERLGVNVNDGACSSTQEIDL